MSNVENSSTLHGWHKRIEALLALVMSRAQGAAQSSAMHASSIFNAAPIAAGGGPGSAANQVTFASAPHTTSPSGKVEISASMSVVETATNGVDFTLVRDAGGVEVPIGATIRAQASTNGHAAGTLTWVDTPPAGSHTYAIRGSNPDSNTISVATGFTQVTIKDVT